MGPPVLVRISGDEIPPSVAIAADYRSELSMGWVDLWVWLSWVGSGHTKWTHGQLCYITLHVLSCLVDTIKLRGNYGQFVVDYVCRRQIIAKARRRRLFA